MRIRPLPNDIKNRLKEMTTRSKTILCCLLSCMTYTTASADSTVIIDSDLTLTQALKGVDSDCPDWIRANQALIEVYYYGFDGKIHKGQLVADFRLAADLQQIFKVAFDRKFPVRQVKPVCVYNWNDNRSMQADNTSAFNYRVIAFTQTLSKHAYGWAVDINPVENPYVTQKATYPSGARYRPDASGTLTQSSILVQEFKKRGWRWGGEWKNKDYQHFEKQLSKKGAEGNRKHYPWLWPVK